MELKKSLQPAACAILVWAIAASLVHAQQRQVQEMLQSSDELVLQKTLQGQIQAAAQAVQLDVPSGQVVQLRFQGTGLHLDLRDAQGRHLRRLAENGRGVQTALWLTRGAAREKLWIVPADSADPGPAAFTLELLNTWATHGPEQPPMEDTPMGPRLQALQQALQQGQGTSSFWREIAQHGTPLVEPWAQGQSLVTFLWRDRGNHNVRLFGSPSGDHNPLRRLPGSDVWWTSVVMDPRARLSYALAPDVPDIGQPAQQRRMILATMQRDPLNKHSFPSHPWSAVSDIYQGRSVVTLAQAPQQPWVAARGNIPAGTLRRHVVHSHILGNDRDVWTYVPAGAAPQNLLVLFDAHAFVHDVPTPRILDNLIADGLLPPTAAVIVGNASPEARGQELPPNPQFAQFMAQELMPWVQAQGLRQLARHTVVAGSSYGGLVSSYLGLTHPELFGNVLSMSGSYWWAPPGEKPGWVQRAWQQLPEPVPDMRFYIDAGLFEQGRGGRAGIVETSAELSHILRKRGVPVTERLFVSGHDYLQWQGSLACGLVALLAPHRFHDERMQVCQGLAQ
ncbi:MAG: alpha/beta hydrolase-fold protein [Comamonas sp.]